MFYYKIKSYNDIDGSKEFIYFKEKKHACDYLRNLKNDYWNSEFAHYRVNGQEVENIDDLTDDEIIKGKVVFDNYVTFYIKEKYIDFKD
jgi:hypothetical protein